MKDLPFLDDKLLGNPLGDWLIAAGLVLLIILAASLTKRVGLRRLDALSSRTATRVDDAIASLVHGTKPWVITLLALWAGSQFLALPAKTETLLAKIVTIVAFIQVGVWCGRLLQWWAERSRAKALEANAAATASFGALVFVGRVLLWSLILLLTLQNLGINVNALVTSLGITGIAVALAVQNVLGDLLASLSIVLDKPFEEGDFIVVEDYMGSVEHIGIKSTRLRSLNGEQIVLSNGDLLKSRLRNYKRMYERRVEFLFRISYMTPVQKLERIPGLVRGIVEAQKSVRFERAHLKKLADSAIEFEVVYWVTNADFNLYMDIQQAINLQLMSAMADEKVNFAAGAVVRVIEPPKGADDKGKEKAAISAATPARKQAEPA